jgi:putative peptidoglycan lipid II flippase
MTTIQDTTSTIKSSVKRFFSGTAISRMTGLIREIMMAAVFGTTPAIAAFWMAFRFAHLLRRLFGEGALHVAFVPHFEGLRKHNSAAGARFFYDLSSAVIAILLLVTLVTEITLASILHFCAIDPNNREVILLTMILLPALLFITLYALNTSLLNCEHTFFLPSVAPAFLNMIWIGGIILVSQLPRVQAIEYLAMMIVFAFALQWLATMPPIFRFLKENLEQEASEKKRGSYKELLRILRPFALGMVGVAATQINSALDALFARAADPEGPAYLWYAIRIQQLPLALVGVALTGAILPPLSRAIQKEDRGQYLHFLNFALKQALLVMVPITGALFVLGFSAINLIYGHGEFSQAATVQTTFCLWAYGSALLPMTSVLILAAAFYAHKNYRIPTCSALLTVILNIGLNTLFVYTFHWSAISIAIATALGALFNALILAHFLNKKEGIVISGIPLLTLKSLLATLLALLATLLFGAHFLHDPTLPYFLSEPLPLFDRHPFTQLLTFSLQALIFTATFLFAAYSLRFHEFFALFSFRKKLSH